MPRRSILRLPVLHFRFPVSRFPLSPDRYMDVFDLPAVDALVKAALAEDLGSGDLTTRLTVSPDARAGAEIAAKEAAVVAGLPLVRKVSDAAGGGVELR